MKESVKPLRSTKYNRLQLHILTFRPWCHYIELYFCFIIHLFKLKSIFLLSHKIYNRMKNKILITHKNTQVEL